MNVPSVANIPYDLIVREACKLWEKCSAFMEWALLSMENIGDQDPHQSAWLAWEVEKILRRTDVSFYRLLREVESHVLPPFKEQVAFIKQLNSETIGDREG